MASKKPSFYDEAIALLADLRELAVRDGKEQAFARRLDDLRGCHARKTSFIHRLDRAGL